MLPHSKMTMIRTLTIAMMMLLMILSISAGPIDAADTTTTTAASPGTTEVTSTTPAPSTTVAPATSWEEWEKQQRIDFVGPWAFFWLCGVFFYGCVLIWGCNRLKNEKKNLTRQAGKFKEPKEPII